VVLAVAVLMSGGVVDWLLRPVLERRRRQDAARRHEADDGRRAPAPAATKTLSNRDDATPPAS
jgi:hypothetical protein